MPNQNCLNKQKLSLGNKSVKIDVVTHYLESDKKFEFTYRFVTVEVNGIVRRIEEHCYGRGEDRADSYVDAICEYSGWDITVKWLKKADAKMPLKARAKPEKPLEYKKKERCSTLKPL